MSETGSFTRAAKELGVPASSVSRRIQDLETELGAVLFTRSTRLVKLTELGQLYLEQISPAISALDNANEVIRQNAENPSGLLRVTASPGYGRFRLMPVLRKLKALYPDIILDVELTDKVLNLAQSEVDIAIRATATLPERAVARRLSSNQFVLVASPNYIEKMGSPKTLLELNQHKALFYRGPHGILRWQAKTNADWEEVLNPIAFISNEGEELIRETLHGTGLSLIPEWGVKQELATKKLVQVKLDDAHIAISRNENSGIYLLYHRPKYSIQKIKAAVDFLVAELTELD